MNKMNENTNGGVPGGDYGAEQANNGTWTIKALPIFSEVKSGARGNDQHIGPEWMNAAIAKCKELQLVQQHMAPVHLGHHGALKNKDTPRVGFLKLSHIGKMTVEGIPSWVLFADVVGITEDHFDGLQKLSHPYRSVEIGDWNKPEIASLALLSDESPYFKFPMLTIGEMKANKKAPMKFEGSDGAHHFFEFAEGDVEYHRIPNPGKLEVRKILAQTDRDMRRKPGGKKDEGKTLLHPIEHAESRGERGAFQMIPRGRKLTAEELGRVKNVPTMKDKHFNSETGQLHEHGRRRHNIVIGHHLLKGFKAFHKGLVEKGERHEDEPLETLHKHFHEYFPKSSHRELQNGLDLSGRVAKHVDRYKKSGMGIYSIREDVVGKKETEKQKKQGTESPVDPSKLQEFAFLEPEHKHLPPEYAKVHAEARQKKIEAGQDVVHKERAAKESVEAAKEQKPPIGSQRPIIRKTGIPHKDHKHKVVDVFGERVDMNATPSRIRSQGDKSLNEHAKNNYSEAGEYGGGGGPHVKQRAAAKTIHEMSHKVIYVRHKDHHPRSTPQRVSWDSHSGIHHEDMHRHFENKGYRILTRNGRKLYRGTAGGWDGNEQIQKGRFSITRHPDTESKHQHRGVNRQPDYGESFWYGVDKGTDHGGDPNAHKTGGFRRKSDLARRKRMKITQARNAAAFFPKTRKGQPAIMKRGGKIRKAAKKRKGGKTSEFHEFRSVRKKGKWYKDPDIPINAGSLGFSEPTPIWFREFTGTPHWLAEFTDWEHIDRIAEKKGFPKEGSSKKGHGEETVVSNWITSDLKREREKGRRPMGEALKKQIQDFANLYTKSGTRKPKVVIRDRSKSRPRAGIDYTIPGPGGTGLSSFAEFTDWEEIDKIGKKSEFPKKKPKSVRARPNLPPKAQEKLDQGLPITADDLRPDLSETRPTEDWTVKHIPSPKGWKITRKPKGFMPKGTGYKGNVEGLQSFSRLMNDYGLPSSNRKQPDARRVADHRRVRDVKGMINRNKISNLKPGGRLQEFSILTPKRVAMYPGDTRQKPTAEDIGHQGPAGKAYKVGKGGKRYRLRRTRRAEGLDRGHVTPTEKDVDVDSSLINSERVWGREHEYPKSEDNPQGYTSEFADKSGFYNGSYKSHDPNPFYHRNGKNRETRDWRFAQAEGGGHRIGGKFVKKRVAEAANITEEVKKTAARKSKYGKLALPTKAGEAYKKKALAGLEKSRLDTLASEISADMQKKRKKPAIARILSSLRKRVKLQEFAARTPKKIRPIGYRAGFIKPGAKGYTEEQRRSKNMDRAVEGTLGPEAKYKASDSTIRGYTRYLAGKKNSTKWLGPKNLQEFADWNLQKNNAQARRVLNRNNYGKLTMNPSGEIQQVDVIKRKMTPLKLRQDRGQAPKMSQFRSKAKWKVQPPGIGWYSEFSKGGLNANQ